MNLDDQTFDSLYRAAKAKEEGGRPDDEVIGRSVSFAGLQQCNRLAHSPAFQASRLPDQLSLPFASLIA